jgi:signal transduction histidine kinase
MLASVTGERFRATQQASYGLLVMVAKIACIIFSIEIAIMFVLSLWDLRGLGVAVDVLDPVTLTLVATPIIYLWVARPFAQAARAANTRLEQQLKDSQLLLEMNERLRASLLETSEMAAETHEKILQKIGGELHDGPAQLLTYTLLQLDRLTPVAALAREQMITVDLEKFRRVLSDTLCEVRAISTGLSLPELATTSIDETITLAIRRHEELTGAKVQLTLHAMPRVISLNQKICTYRFIQEALANSTKHAHAKTHRVDARGGAQIQICVQDDGDGFTPEKSNGRGLGLTGMRARLQALGGRLEVQSAPGQGARVTASFSLETGQAA